MKPLTQLAHEAIAKRLATGHITVDLTAGNGHDTLFLAKTVAPHGHVYAFDIQEAALDATRTRLVSRGLEAIVSLIDLSHANWTKALPIEQRGHIQAIVMNLGYLPGSDKSIVTRIDSTLAALEVAFNWLAVGGMLSVVAYTGHSGGQEEADAVQAFLQRLDSEEFQITREPAADHPLQPFLYLVEKMDTQTARRSWS